MIRITNRLNETDRRIRECNVRLELYRRRIAAKERNPALAEQADQLMFFALDHLKKLVIYRKRLKRVLERDTFLSPYDHKVPRGPPHLPRHMR